MRPRARGLLLLFIVLSLPVSVFGEGKFCGSRESHVYHYPECRYVKEIKPENLVWFKNETEAVAAGYRPCQVCKPPLPTNTTTTTMNVTVTTTRSS